MLLGTKTIQFIQLVQGNKEYIPDWSILVVLVEVLFEESKSIIDGFTVAEEGKLKGILPISDVVVKANLNDTATDIIDSQEY